MVPPVVCGTIPLMARFHKANNNFFSGPCSYETLAILFPLCFFFKILASLVAKPRIDLHLSACFLTPFYVYLPLLCNILFQRKPPPHLYPLVFFEGFLVFLIKYSRPQPLLWNSSSVFKEPYSTEQYIIPLVLPSSTNL